MLAVLLFTQVFASSPEFSLCSSKENYETVSNSDFNSPVTRGASYPYVQKIRSTREALNAKFCEFSGDPEASKIPWKQIYIYGWPESVKTMKSASWSRKDTDAIMEALPNIRFEWKTDKHLEGDDTAHEEQSPQQDMKRQRIDPDIDFNFLQKDGWGVQL